MQGSRSYQRPSSNELSNFLNLPTGQSSRPSVSGATGTGSRTYETPGGGSVTVGRGSGSTTTPGGTTVGGAGAGVVVQGANGQTYAKGRGAVGATDGTNSAIAAGSRTGIQTANGETAVGGRGIRAATDGQNTVVRGGAGGVVQDRYGNTRAGVAGGTIATDGRNVYTSKSAVRAIRDPAGNVVASGRAIETYNGARISDRQVVAVRRGFNGYGLYYTPRWYARYPGAWFAAGVLTNAWWNGAYWDSANDYCGCSGEPVSYDYGDSITYDDGMVYAGEEVLATAEQYAEQAADIADAGAKTENEEWLPLGVFAIVSEGQETSDKILQLAVNKEGVLRGNLHDKLTDQVTAVVGAVDRETQRAAFRPDNKEFPVAECGLYNLTQSALTLLVHFDAERTEQRSLIRLEEPENQ
ncbi:MAG: hypothetical protein ACI9G1_002300 [Pirellulaceae bacterium]|jgi:hypothetical protein